MIIKPRITFLPALFEKYFFRLVSYHSRNYNPYEISDLLDLFARLGLRKNILEVNMFTWKAHSLWLKKFEKVISVALDLDAASRLVPYLARRRSTIIVGKPYEISTMKEICSSIQTLDVLFIDIAHYPHLMPCYVIYSKLVRPNGVIAFAHSRRTNQEHKSIEKFINDLRSGYVDGYQHNIHEIQRGGSGISYEVKENHGLQNTYGNKNDGCIYNNNWFDIRIAAIYFINAVKQMIGKMYHV